MCKLNEKFKAWEKWYSENELSVCAQIRDMLWDAAIFYTINEARRYATTDAQGKPELNTLVHGLINRSFLKTQSLSIRKLYSAKNAFSLGRLIKDMENNSKLLTRENILSALELPYDYEQATDEGRRTGNSEMALQGAHSKNVHKNIDLLAGVGPAQRQPSDTVQDDVFKRLNEWLGKCKPIANFADKIVAHTITKKGIKKIPQKHLRISLAGIHRAHCRIVRIAAFVGQVILYKSSGTTRLSSYVGDKFEHFDKPWVTRDSILKLEGFWKRYEKDIERLSEQPERRILRKKVIRENPC